MTFNYRWTFKDYPKEKNGYKVFSCFACGGGSTMGYKLAGYDVIGCNEIDKKMMEVYKINHNPKYAFLEDIRDFVKRETYPDELYNLDILDGSPPCSSFSMAGARQEHWGKEKKFREGQELQVLDTLFFDFIELAKKLQPKIVIAENVKGLLLGEAMSYVNKIYKAFDEAGYYVFHQLLNASTMGVPQRRERVFFIAMRKNIADKINCDSRVDMFNHSPFLDLTYNEKPIYFKEYYLPGVNDNTASQGKMYEYWKLRDIKDNNIADTIQRVFNEYRCFNNYYLKQDIVCWTLTSGDDNLFLYDEYRKPNKSETCCIATFPQDYDFNSNKYIYICGMSVPPVMMAQIAKRVQKQWLDKMELTK